MTAKCKVPYCMETECVISHIIPQSFARAIREKSNHNIKITNKGAFKARQQNGLFADDILCNRHENLLSDIDRRAFEMINRFRPKISEAIYKVYKDETLNYDNLSQFVLSVAWRASKISRYDYKSIKLGRYDKLISGALFGNEEFPATEMILSCPIGRWIETKNYYSMPINVKIFGMNFIVMTLGGICFSIKLDKRGESSLSELDRSMYRYMRSNSDDGVRLMNVPFEHTADFSYFRNIIRNQKSKNYDTQSR